MISGPDLYVNCLYNAICTYINYSKYKVDNLVKYHNKY